MALAQPAVRERVDRRHAAAEREREEQHAVDGERLGEAEPLLVERIVGGLAVRLERDEGGEVRGNALAVAAHVAQLAHAEPRAPRQRGEHEGGEHEGEKRGAQGVWKIPRGRDTIGATRNSRERWLKWRSTRPRWCG